MKEHVWIDREPIHNNDTELTIQQSQVSVQELDSQEAAPKWNFPIPREGRLPMCPNECKWKPQKKQLVSFVHKPCGTGLRMTRIFTC